MDLFVSIIIPFKKFNSFVEECVQYCNSLDYSNYEVILLPDEDEKKQFPKVIIHPTGDIGPSEKRNIGMKIAKGEILAMLDDDAYPVSQWLKKAVQNFADPEVAAVGGPAVTPDSDDFMQKASGLVYSSIMASGEYTYRYLPKARREVDDYPTCNLIIRRSVLEEIGGFDKKYWPGEDTIICLKITKELHKKIIYDPKVFVYHHRRRLFLSHLKQVASYAQHRGNFVKKFPETSAKLSYFIPSFFVLWLIIGFILSVFVSQITIVYQIILAVYLLLLLFFTSFTNLRLYLITMLGIYITHFTYGVYFLIGLFTRELKR
ncbi:MAG: glycosyltransferase [Candidatus Firestonebacteria bacterium]